MKNVCSFAFFYASLKIFEEKKEVVKRKKDRTCGHRILDKYFPFSLGKTTTFYAFGNKSLIIGAQRRAVPLVSLCSTCQREKV
jgi:hypothetical protein